MILQLPCKEDMLKKLKNNDKDQDPEGGSGRDLQPSVCTSTSGDDSAEGDLGKPLVVYNDSTNVQPVNR